MSKERTNKRTETHACDSISRQDAIDEIRKCRFVVDAIEKIRELPPAEPERHYCRECKWRRCHINVDKHGESETYWWCLNWDGETDEEGYCHEWERRTDETD